MNGKSTVLIFAVLFTVTTAESDQEYWIRQSEEIAIRGLDQWPDVVTALNDDNPTPADDQLKLWQSHVADSVENMNTFVPRLIWIVDVINSIAAGEPNILRRSELQAILLAIEGQRDNKSYYLLDGAVNWVVKRLAALTAGGDRANDLAPKLSEAQVSVANLRDKLDGSAQYYVKSMTRIQELKGDICGNIAEIRAIASALLTALQSSVLLQDAAVTNELIKSISA